MFNLCSFVYEEEVNHHFSFNSCDKELQIFELKRQDKEKDILMASVVHDQRAPLGSSQFYNKKVIGILSTLIEPSDDKPKSN